MYKKLIAQDHVIAMQLSDQLTGDDIKKYKNILDEKLATHAHLSIFVDFTGLSDMNADALVEGTKADLKFLSHVYQFNRCAFVSDKEWPQAVISFMEPAFPRFEMKVFTSDRSEEAMNWVAELPKAPTIQTPAFRFIPTSKDDVLAFEINGMISSEEMPDVIKKFGKFLEGHEKVQLLNRIKHFGGIDPRVFMQGGLISMKFAAMQKIERYAIVGAPGWMRKIIEMINPVFADIDMRIFSENQENDAWVWLGAEPAE